MRERVRGKGLALGDPYPPRRCLGFQQDEQRTSRLSACSSLDLKALAGMKDSKNLGEIWTLLKECSFMQHAM